MKLSPSPACPPSSGPSPRAAAGRNETPARAEPRETRDAFERAMHAKALPLACGETEATEPDAASSEGATPMLGWVCVPLVRAGEAPAPTPVVIETATGTRAAIETALHNSAPPAGHPLASTDRPAVWEASIGGPLGTVEVRAERLATQGAPASWGLTIGAPALGADVAARPTARLHERLRKHGIEVDHVRIERKRERDDLPR